MLFNIIGHIPNISQEVIGNGVIKGYDEITTKVMDHDNAQG